MKFLIILLVICSLYSVSNAQNCKYNKNGFKEVPWGHIQSTVELGNFREIKGKTIVANQAIYGVKIALFKLNRKNATFVGSQVSDTNGNFCFKNLPNGKYELRMGMDGLNSRYFTLTLIKKDKKLSQMIEAVLEIGT